MGNEGNGRPGFANGRGLWYGSGMKKKAFYRILAALLALTALCGCRAVTPEPTPSPEPSPTPTVDPHEGMVEVFDGMGGTMWIPESEVLNKFEPDINAFAVGNDMALYNGTGWTLKRGIDVSAHQGEIDWQAVAGAGIEFAIIRCAWRGYGEGLLYEDECYRQNIEGALAAGLEVGVYIYSQATDILEAAEEALFVAELLEGYEVTMPVFFDWERPGVDEARTNGTGGETITQCALEFCRLIEAAGYEPGVYTYLSLAYHEYDLDALAGLTLWLGNPSAYPEFYYEHQFWQYSFEGDIPGISVPVDLNVMYVKEEPAL